MVRRSSFSVFSGSAERGGEGSQPASEMQLTCIKAEGIRIPSWSAAVEGTHVNAMSAAGGSRPARVPCLQAATASRAVGRRVAAAGLAPFSRYLIPSPPPWTCWPFLLMGNERLGLATVRSMGNRWWWCWHQHTVLAAGGGGWRQRGTRPAGSARQQRDPNHARSRLSSIAVFRAESPAHLYAKSFSAIAAV